MNFSGTDLKEHPDERDFRVRNRHGRLCGILLFHTVIRTLAIGVFLVGCALCSGQDATGTGTNTVVSTNGVAAMPDRVASDLIEPFTNSVLPLIDGKTNYANVTSNGLQALISSNHWSQQMTPAFREQATQVSNSNVAPLPDVDAAKKLKQYQFQLELARKYLRNGQYRWAETNLVSILESQAPEELKHNALLELAVTLQKSGKSLKAIQVYSQFVNRYPKDSSVPEVFLRQGLLYRQIGAYDIALTKFYSVMTAALSLKLDHFEYYQRLVLQAQTEIADTYYLQSEFDEAAKFFERLLRIQSSELNKSLIQFKLIRSLYYADRLDELIARAKDYLSRFPGTMEEPEVRFLLSLALKKKEFNQEAAQQVLKLLSDQSANVLNNPEVWRYWQQKAGNQIANQLYQEGDYMNALNIYVSLSQLSTSPDWKIPVLYQIGLTYEHLDQQPKAIETYDRILDFKNNSSATTNSVPALDTVFEMAEWRKRQLEWFETARKKNSELEINLYDDATN
ncbi:MAG: tetratricopeptide repeat protein [Verrucomicrobia bacterium]|nr:tetratricopeptide repeat protein [Verrucomicrobiota bacterium]MCF7707283.1 tetratricopeptide repeat protein [Verrucomicrobiota bacterium]